MISKRRKRTKKRGGGGGVKARVCLDITIALSDVKIYGKKRSLETTDSIMNVP